jgi:hypothetical protein
MSDRNLVYVIVCGIVIVLLSVIDCVKNHNIQKTEVQTSVNS